MSRKHRRQPGLLHDRRGMTLTELLATVLIMSLVTMAIAAGVTAASRVYRRITLRANAQTLLATTVAALSGDFRAARDVETGGDQVSLYSENRHCQIQVSNGRESGRRGIILTVIPRTQENASEAGETTVISLVSEKAQTLGLYNEITGIAYSGDTFTFTVRVYSTSAAGDEGQLMESQEVRVRNIVREQADTEDG